METTTEIKAGGGGGGAEQPAADCGCRNNDVQFAGELQPRGCHYCLKISSGDRQMLNRQVVKSGSATIKIPELDFEIPSEAQRGSLSTVQFFKFFFLVNCHFLSIVSYTILI
ncbi:unnamed protein product [Coffea canephora]|uniref:Zinc finger ZPR1-type domain-containing protein n=1 Tax=Coffea canephora TaxID=49390 RepID=A0A068U9B5_COFCA|nr:unnamed protein product [Coffea canephora]